MKNIFYVDNLLMWSDLGDVAAEIDRFAPTSQPVARDEVYPKLTPEIGKLLLSLNSIAFVEKVRQATGIEDLSAGNSYFARYQVPLREPSWKAKSQGGRFGRIAVECELVVRGFGVFEYQADGQQGGIELKPGRLVVFVRENGVTYRRQAFTPMASGLVEYASRSWVPKSAPGAVRAMMLDMGGFVVA